MKTLRLKSLLRITGLSILALALPLLAGCNEEYLLFQPKGEIAAQEKDLILMSFWIMMLVVVPVIIMTIWFPIKYRAGRKETEKSKYTPNWEHSNKIEFWVWSIPTVIIIWLAYITFQTSHSLDPRKPIVAEKETMRVHVVALDWKWLFIYPEQEIATINELTIPVDTPVEFLITSDTVMNSFSIPNLGSMIYAMAGMENQLHLIGNEVGTYRGYSANYSGFGFSGMKFNTHVVEDAEFDSWVNKVKSSEKTLTPEVFQQLTVKTKDNAVEHYSKANPLTFSYIVEKYTGPQGANKHAAYVNPYAAKKAVKEIKDNTHNQHDAATQAGAKH